MLGVGQYNDQCQCPPGMTGVWCDIDTDECASEPCQHEGSLCTDDFLSYTCDCAVGFSGDNCEGQNNECGSQPCQNSGVCVDFVDSYVCECVGAFGGDNCEHRKTCADSPCVNDEFPVGAVAICTDHTGSMFTCACPPGFQGDRCEINIDECAAAPCNSGVCVDGVNAYSCICPSTYSGINCDSFTPVDLGVVADWYAGSSLTANATCADIELHWHANTNCFQRICARCARALCTVVRATF
jgi:hypothetical protein